MTVTQTKKGGTGSGPSATVTLDAPTATGSGIVIAADFRNSAGTLSATDNQGNTYSVVPDIASHSTSTTPNRLHFLYRPAVGATAGVTSVTVTQTGATGGMAVRVFEVPSLGTLADSDVLSDLTDTNGNTVSPVASGAGFSLGAMCAGVTSRTYAVSTPSGTTTPSDDPTTISTNVFMQTAWKDVTAGTIGYSFNRTSGSVTNVGLLAATWNTAVTNPIPVVSVGADRTVDTGSAVSITATASVSSGSIASYAWTVVSGTAVTLSGASTATVSFTAPAPPGSTVLRCTVTSNLGETASDDLTVTYLTAGQYARPTTDVGSGIVGVTKEPTSAVTFRELIDETTPSATDYISLGTGSTYRVTLGALTPVSSTSGWVLRLMWRVNAETATHTVRVRLIQGATTIATRTVTNLTNSHTVYDYTLTSGEVEAIPDQSVPIDVVFDNVTLT